MDYLTELGLVRYRPKSAQETPLLGVSFPLTDDSRAFCQAVADAMAFTLVEKAVGLHWGPGGDIAIDPQQCLNSASFKRQLWQQLYPHYDAQHSNC
ncbi:hypothetical protein [Gallaecimonas mangrovi]|uniref:hypothetical protein n=1 Tax=Gallaecimonas mangrovi TaxID=2291597 RepID=UPI00126028FB|nr:hypothetical protein [Gallaecimonas mangrovi]